MRSGENGEIVVTRPVAAICGVILVLVIVGAGTIAWQTNARLPVIESDMQWVRAAIERMEATGATFYSRADADRDWQAQAHINARVSQDLRDIEGRVRALETGAAR